MTIKRYQPGSNEEFRCYEMIEDPEGGFVRYDDFKEMTSVMNPCGHTGFESVYCSLCGYPDPRKALAQLREELSDLQVEYNRLQTRYDRMLQELGAV